MQPEATIRIAVVDDHPMVRRGVTESFAETAELKVVAEGATAEDAIRIANETAPDVMLLDVNMPGGGLAAAERIRKTSDTRILFLSIREDLETVREALRLGGGGFLSKGVNAEELVAFARKVAAGERVVSAELAARLLTESESESGGRQQGDGRREAPSDLTTRERQVLTLLGEGLSNARIAERLQLSENTVKHYLTPLLRKLGVKSRTEAALLAQRFNL